MVAAAAHAGLTRGWGLDQGGNATPAEPGGLEHKARGFGARRGSANLHDLVEPLEPLDLVSALHGIADDRGQRVGELFRRAILLQKFRNDVFADDQIGKDDARQPRSQPYRPRNHGLDEVQPIGCDHRHSRERKLKRHRARCGERRPRAAERGPLLRGVDDNFRLYRPAGDAVAHLAFNVRNGRQYELDRSDAGAEALDPRRIHSCAGSPRRSGCRARSK